jgi:hypothetical protein
VYPYFVPFQSGAVKQVIGGKVVNKAGLQRGRDVQVSLLVDSSKTLRLLIYEILYVSLLLHFLGVSTDQCHERIGEMMQKIFR